MATLQHFSHSCPLYTPEEIEEDGICNICFKEEPVEFTCKPCNFDLCKACSHLPQKVSHDFHSEHHPLEFCLYQYDRKPAYIICSGCGNMSSCSFYECKKCDIYLDLACALLKNTVTGWDAKEMLHDSHQHLLRRCRPGQDARGSCLLCEYPLSPSSVCYGCVYCYSFLHERCLDLPTEIQHPVHPKHPLKRLDYLRGGGRMSCDACEVAIDGAPFGCLECNFDIHMRCADSLLRGLKHESHEHKLLYVTFDVEKRVCRVRFDCPICNVDKWSPLGCFYRCILCKLRFHFECLGIPESMFKSSCHVHPLVCRRLSRDDQDDSLEYCGVCETMVVAKNHHVYSCQECDFLAHIECILRGEEEPSPLYLKDLYSRGEHATGTRRIRQGNETNNVEDIIMIKDKEHNHVMREITFDQLTYDDQYCRICKKEIIAGNPWRCKIKRCNFLTHSICAELGKPSRHPCHWNHLLTLAPVPLARDMMNCYSCRKEIRRFNLFCRICNFVIHVTCAIKGKLFLGMLGPKVVGTWRGRCSRGKHWLVQVRFTKKYQFPCHICYEKIFEKGVSCTECETIYHLGCIGMQCTRVMMAGSDPPTSSDESEIYC